MLTSLSIFSDNGFSAAHAPLLRAPGTFRSKKACDSSAYQFYISQPTKRFMQKATRPCHSIK